MVIDQIWVCVFLITGIAISGPLLADLSDEAQECVDCHEAEMPAMVTDWRSSLHAENDVSWELP
jgi:hypothetical protein